MCYSQVRTGGWVYFEVSFCLIGVLEIVGAHFLSFFSFNPSPPSLSHARALVEGLDV